MGAPSRQRPADAGLRLTLLDTCYLHGGFGAEPEGVQRRFSDGTAAAWAERAAALDALAGPGLRVGAAIHSVRAVDPASMEVVAAWAAERGAPLHAHVSEQPAENRDCLAAHGLTPTALLARAAPWASGSRRSTPPTSPTPTSATSAGTAARCAAAPRPSATWPTASARPGGSSTPEPG